jgi:hypothetical protein
MLCSVVMLNVANKSVMASLRWHSGRELLATDPEITGSNQATVRYQKKMTENI